jgi:hypothetical protein
MWRGCRGDGLPDIEDAATSGGKVKKVTYDPEVEVLRINPSAGNAAIELSFEDKPGVIIRMYDKAATLSAWKRSWTPPERMDNPRAVGHMQSWVEGRPGIIMYYRKEEKTP